MPMPTNEEAFREMVDCDGNAFIVAFRNGDQKYLVGNLWALLRGIDQREALNLIAWLATMAGLTTEQIEAKINQIGG